MGAFSTYLQQKVVEQFLRNNPTTPPANIYVALYETAPGAGAVGGAETAYTNYVRETAVWTATNASGQTSNTATLTYPANGNAANSVTINAIVLFDAATGGNALFWAPLSTPKTLSPGDVLSFAAGALVFGLS